MADATVSVGASATAPSAVPTEQSSTTSPPQQITKEAMHPVTNAEFAPVNQFLLSARSPKKRERTDSLKTMLPPPTAQRIKQEASAKDTTTDTTPSIPTTPSSSAKLLMKDRKGSHLNGVPHASLILNAVKQAPPAKEKSNPRRWSKAEDESLRQAVLRSGERNWKAIADQVPGRNHTQCLQRWTKVLKPGLIKGHWTPEEDAKLRELVAEGRKNWGQVASLIPGRTSKQCRERWCNHLDPNINKGSYTEEEDKIILEMQARLGNRWSIIAQQLKGRTEDAVKIRWKSLMRGKRAAAKEEKNAMNASATSPSRPKKTTPTKSRTRAASPVTKQEPSTASFASTMPPSLSVSTASEQSDSTATTPATSPALLPTSAKDPTLVIAMSPVGSSLQNLNINSENVTTTTTTSQSTTTTTHVFSTASSVNAQTTTQVLTQPLFVAVNDAAGNVIYVNTQPGTSNAPQFIIPPNQFNASGLPPNYVMATNLSVAPSPNMTIPMQLPLNQFTAVPHPVMTSSSRPMSLAPSSSYAISTATIAYPPNAPAPIMIAGSSPYVPPMASGTPAPMHMMNRAMTPAPAPAPAAPVASSIPAAPAASAPAPLAVVPEKSKVSTPKEEWGASHTPRSHMMLTEGHTSAYELFHQQRLRLILQERERNGLSLSSAPSPGQAMLTKELKANKERQKRQAILQKGWKSAVEAIMALQDELPLSSAEETNQSLLEKVSLSALDDPTEETLMDSSVDLITAEDTTNESHPTAS